MAVGVVHRHDRRECWDCGGLGIAAGAVSLRVTERALVAIGWRFLEPGGRMVCSDCAWARRQKGAIAGTIDAQEGAERA